MVPAESTAIPVPSYSVFRPGVVTYLIGATFPFALVPNSMTPNGFSSLFGPQGQSTYRLPCESVAILVYQGPVICVSGPAMVREGTTVPVSAGSKTAIDASAKFCTYKLSALSTAMTPGRIAADSPEAE